MGDTVGQASVASTRLTCTYYKPRTHCSSWWWGTCTTTLAPHSRSLRWALGDIGSAHMQQMGLGRL
eukprot:6917153-Karenia_brevis.AAC.1